MKFVNVDSNNIDSVGYDFINCILDIKFTHGAIYRYYEVDKNEVIKLLFSKSVGKYFHANIAKEYRYERI